MLPVINREVAGFLTVLADAHDEQDEETDKVLSYSNQPFKQGNDRISLAH
jgi:hypothetical protein